jgi:hypothetical protein
MTKRIHNGLNLKERKIVAQFVKVGRPHAMTLDELAETFAYVGKSKSNSWARNSLRRPIALGILEPTGPKGSGTYQITTLGRELVKSGALELVSATPKAKKSKAAKAPKLQVVEPKVEAAPAPAPMVVVEPKVAEAPAVVEVVSTPTVVTSMAELVTKIATDVAKAVEEKKPEAQPTAPWANEPS